MALWGNFDNKTASGTIAIAADGAVTGTSTAFTTEARIGDYILVAAEYYQIVTITSDTAAKVRAGIPGATLTAVSAGASYSLTEKPAFVTTESASTSGVHGDVTKVFGVDTNEYAAERDQGTPAGAHSGWVRRVAGSGGRAGRVFTETLVAMGTITGDLEDVVMQDLNINITTQPSAVSVTSPADAVFTVVASTVPSGGTLSYQWQVSTDSGSTWANTVDASGTAATLTVISTDAEYVTGNQFRCNISATGATTVTSNAVAVTIA